MISDTGKNKKKVYFGFINYSKSFDYRSCQNEKFMTVLAVLDHLIIIVHSDKGVIVRTEFGELE